jgi:phage terminase large subunit-like protein
LDDLSRVVVGVDPAGGGSDTNDEVGIVAGGIMEDGHVYILNDASGHLRASEWAKKSCDLYDLYSADRIVAERNFGGDMVELTINSHRRDIHPKLVHAARGKAVRAEPVSSMYDKGMVHHVGNGLGELEKEMAGYVPGKEKEKSPGRMDAVVWVVTELALKQKAEPRIRQL